MSRIQFKSSESENEVAQRLYAHLVGEGHDASIQRTDHDITNWGGDIDIRYRPNAFAQPCLVLTMEEG